MGSENQASPIAPVTAEIPDNRHYRVDVAAGHEGCISCGHDAFYTVTYEDAGERVEIGQSWMDADLADDICDLMNDAYEAGKEAAAVDPHCEHGIDIQEAMCSTCGIGELRYQADGEVK